MNISTTDRMFGHWNLYPNIWCVWFIHHSRPCLFLCKKRYREGQVLRKTSSQLIRIFRRRHRFCHCCSGWCRQKRPAVDGGLLEPSTKTFLAVYSLWTKSCSHRYNHSFTGKWTIIFLKALIALSYNGVNVLPVLVIALK